MNDVKTSKTHPLPLAGVTPAHGHGRILFTLCPGKVQPHAETGPWDRSLSADMDSIASAGATALLTLMEEIELQRCGLNSKVLREASSARRMHWLHNPIEDFRTPSEAWETAWASIGQTLRQKLQNGETIVIHCRGGRGRAGMVAARLLIESGMAPEEAVTLVRKERPEAIETAEQEAHVRACVPITP